MAKYHTLPNTTGRCIAPDLIGFGNSGKPDIDYSFQDYIAFIKEFIRKLGLENIVLVIHDWGGAIGFNYAMKHPEHVKGMGYPASRRLNFKNFGIDQEMVIMSTFTYEIVD